MAKNNKTYIQKALDKQISKYKISGQEDIEDLRKKLMATIKGNEEEYIEYVEEQIRMIKEQVALKNDKEVVALAKAAKENFGIEPDETEVAAAQRIFGNTEGFKVYRESKKGRVANLTFVLLAVTVISGCNTGSVAVNKDGLETTESTIQTNIEQPSLPVKEPQEKIVEPSAEELAMQEFVKATVEDTIEACNGMLSSGVALIDEELNDEAQKELIAKLGLQYYIVANIDDITPTEYINFMQAEHGNVIDNDDLIYNFRNLNEVFKDQIMVSTPDDKIDFATFFRNENDAKLLNDAADILARFNAAEKKSEKEKISAEFYEYILSVFNEDLSNFKYSNSALSTFINAEFSAWCELTKSAKFKKGAYADDELEARVMTVTSKCGMSEGEEQELDIIDETKTSLESINATRVLNTLNSRAEAAKTAILYDFASYGELIEQVMSEIDLSLFKKLESYTDKLSKEIENEEPVVHKNDSQVSNGQGGTIANSEFVEHDIDPTSPTAKEDYEQSVRQETEKQFEKEIVTKNEDGEVADPTQLAAWAQQGAIDANNGTYNNNVPSLYKGAYDNGYNAAKAAKEQAEAQASQSSSTTFEKTEEKVVEQEETIEEQEFVPNASESQTQTPPQEQAPELPLVPEIPTEVTDPNYEQTTFIPVGSDGEIVSEEVVEETYTGFVDSANSSRTIEVKTLTRDEQLQELYQLRNEASLAAAEAIKNANLMSVELEESNKTK